VDYARDVVARVGIVVGEEIGDFPGTRVSRVLPIRKTEKKVEGAYLPVLGIAAAHNDFDNDLVRPGFWDRYILNSDLWAFGNDGFFHLVYLFLVWKRACMDFFALSRDFCSKWSGFNDAAQPRGSSLAYISCQSMWRSCRNLSVPIILDVKHMD
jgi:hypothetical protein